MEAKKKYYLGLDIGTDSVGYAVTDEQYKPIKFNGEPLIGTHLIDATEDNVARRNFRTARRRLDRRQQRIGFIREIFAKEIEQTDANFYKRLDCSALFAEDKALPSKNSFFNDDNYNDKNYHTDYPTIHHLITALMNGTAKRDVRLLYLAVAYLVAHRGHFLSEADKDDIAGVLDFERIYTDFVSYFEQPIWCCDSNALAEILKKKIGITAKEKELIALIYGGKKPKATEDDNYDRALIIKLLAGGKVKAEALYLNKEYYEISSFSLSINDEDFDTLISELGDDGDLLILMKKLYDWSILVDLVPNGQMLSERKVDVYNQHKKDLKFLKSFVKKYIPNKYNEIFRSSSVPANYVAYSYNLKSTEDRTSVKHKATKYDFCEYILKIVKDIDVDVCDKKKYEDMLQRLNKDTSNFMPKQIDSDNRVIPYQLYYTELVKVLDISSSWLPFLKEADSSGTTPYEKIISTFLYRVPYYVGPLNAQCSKNAWAKRTNEKVYPWNFDKVIDEDKSEEAFIRKMTNKCTYLPGEDVLPKNSLLYTKYEVLNEINNLKINGVKIDIETKQSLYNERFSEVEKMTPKRIRDFLISKGKIKAEDTISGIDISVKSSLKSYIFFKPYIENGNLSESDVEKILSSKAYSEDTYRFRKWLKIHYPNLSDIDIKRISNQKFKEFGRLSKKLLCEIEGTNKSTGETYTIIDALWNTNSNLMQLLSNEFTFMEKIDAFVGEYYAENPKTLSERLNDMYIPTSVKRPVIRTLDIIKDIVKAEKCPPEKIFVEMARGADENQKNKRTLSRRDQILDFYKAYGKTDEINMLKEQLATKDERELRGEALFLYFMQLGKCMYSGSAIDINLLGTNTYNVDHIYPRSFVKDDSIDNKVLVLSIENADKSNEYPISSEIRSKMYGFWKALKEKDLISDEKFNRLTRSTEFTEEERWNFINRQLVETRQSTKAVTTLLKELYPNTEIVYVKAGLVSEFRQAFDLIKSRSVNDLHHAKDAYLNIVVGNAYNSVFTKKWFNPNNKDYSIKAETFFGMTHKPDGKCVWNGSESIAFVKNIMAKNNIHLTKYAFCKHGGFFDRMPVKAGTNDLLVPRKKELDPKKYGGYNRTTASFFILVRFEAKKKHDLIFMPVEVMFADKFISDMDFATEYSKKTIGEIVNQIITNIEFPLGMRKIKINTMLELDGFKALITSKANGGKVLGLTPFISLKIGHCWEQYVKKLESFAKKIKSAPNICPSEHFDKITHQQNEELYQIYLSKLSSPIYSKMPGASSIKILEDGFEKFKSQDLSSQITILLNIGMLMKTNRKGGCDLEALGGSKSSGSLTLSSCVSNWKKNYQSAYIIDSSASGIYENKSQNLFNLL